MSQVKDVDVIFLFQALKTEKDNEIKEQQKHFEKKERERAKQEEKRVAALEKKVQLLCFVQHLCGNWMKLI